MNDHHTLDDLRMLARLTVRRCERCSDPATRYRVRLGVIRCDEHSTPRDHDLLEAEQVRRLKKAGVFATVELPT